MYLLITSYMLNTTIAYYLYSMCFLIQASKNLELLKSLAKYIE